MFARYRKTFLHRRTQLRCTISPLHYTSLTINDEYSHISRDEASKYECTHVDEHSRIVCTLYTVVERTFSRVLAAASISCSRRAYSSSNVNPIYGKFLPFFLLFLFLFFLLFSFLPKIHTIKDDPSRPNVRRQIQGHGSTRVGDRGFVRIYRRLFVHGKTTTLHLLALQNLA